MIRLGLCREAEGRAVNIGSGDEWSIEQTARMLMEATGRVVPILEDEARLRPPSSEVNRLRADIGLLLALTRWRPETHFREGIRQTVEWIHRNLGRFDSARFDV
jgi:nucleoside-diphosphate-sugar epimerase